MRYLLALSASCLLTVFLAGDLRPVMAVQGTAAPAPALLETSEAQRRQYLAEAVIWKPSGVPTPQQLREGPAGRNPLKVRPDPAGAIACRYERGGAGSAGRTAKFTCRTDSGRSIRVKYYDGNPRTGNREVFAEVAATRLFWALGFDADPMYPVTVVCRDCPENPMTGQGPRAERRFLGVVEAFYEGTIISSSTDLNEGWSFGEVAEAIAALPPGEARDRQQMYFDALSLLAVFVQHGDRKPSQQRLVCRMPLDVTAGDLEAFDNDAGFQLPVLMESEDARACAGTGLTIQDLGATFGGAGEFTLNVNAKVHLASWAGTPVFANRAAVRARQSGGIPECHGNIVASRTAGPGAADNPRISEAGRRFLYDRLSALTPDHVRAIFEAARLDQLDETQRWRDHDGRVLTGVDAWVAVFLDKVAAIGQMTCPS